MFTDGGIASELAVTAHQFACGEVAGEDQSAITADHTIWDAIVASEASWFDISAAPPSLPWSGMDDMFTAGL